MASDSTKQSKIFSPPIYLEIARLVAQGLSAAEIADRIGCKLGTLRVRCSQYGISLRRNSAAGASEGSSSFRLSIRLSQATVQRLQKQARKAQTSGAKLAAELIEAIVRDELYGAVLDHDRGDKVVAMSRRHAG
jgi:hypothetical protein